MANKGLLYSINLPGEGGALHAILELAATVDNEWTNIAASGSLLDGTPVKHAERYDTPISTDTDLVVQTKSPSATYDAPDSGVGVAQELNTLELGSPLLGAVHAVHTNLTQPVANSTSGVHAAITLTGAPQLNITGGITNPSNRRVTVTGNQASQIGAVTIHGTDENSATISETLQLNATTTVEGVLGFKTVTAIDVPALTTAGDTVIVGTGSLVSITGFTNPDVPRVLTITGNQATCAGNVDIYGTDFAGDAMSDTIALAGTSTVVGVKAFKTVTKMVVPARAAASDAVEIGTGNLIGLNVALSDNFVLVTIFNGTRVAADTVVVVTDPSVLSHNTIGTYGTPDGAKGLRVMVGVS